MKNPKIIRNLLLTVTALVSVVALAACGPSGSPTATPTLTASSSPSASSTPSSSPSDVLTPMPQPAANFPCTNPAPSTAAPSAAQLANYQAVIDSANTQPMATHACDPLTFIIAGSECCGAIQRDDALVKYGVWLQGKGPWTFGVDAATLADWQSGFYAQYVPDNSLIAVSTSGQWVTSVIFDGDVISAIFAGMTIDMSY